MLELTFKIKPTVYSNAAPDYLIPAAVKAHHYQDAAAWRRSKRFGSLFNSQLMPALITRELAAVGIQLGHRYETGQLPACVSVDSSGMLHTVTVQFEDAKQSRQRAA